MVSGGPGTASVLRSGVWSGTTGEEIPDLNRWRRALVRVPEMARHETRPRDGALADFSYGGLSAAGVLGRSGHRPAGLLRILRVFCRGAAQSQEVLRGRVRV